MPGKIEIHITRGERETEDLARNFASRLTPGTTVAVEGELGAGKTAFVRGAASFFGVNDTASPSYSLINEYAANGKNRVGRILHLDMYRIRSEEDFLSLGFYDYPRESLVFIEWFEMIAGFFGAPGAAVRISKKAGGEREISIEWNE